MYLNWSSKVFNFSMEFFALVSCPSLWSSTTSSFILSSLSNKFLFVNSWSLISSLLFTSCKTGEVKKSVPLFLSPEIPALPLFFDKTSLRIFIISSSLNFPPFLFCSFFKIVLTVLSFPECISPSLDKYLSPSYQSFFRMSKWSLYFSSSLMPGVFNNSLIEPAHVLFFIKPGLLFSSRPNNSNKREILTVEA